jgi:hypothetical protein
LTPITISGLVQEHDFHETEGEEIPVVTQHYKTCNTDYIDDVRICTVTTTPKCKPCRKRPAAGNPLFLATFMRMFPELL